MNRSGILYAFISVMIPLAFFAGEPSNFSKDPGPKIASQTITFTENKGQVGDQNYKPRPDVLFSGSANGLSFHLLRGGIMYQLSRVDSWKDEEFTTFAEARKIPDQSTLYRLDVNWPGANQNAEIIKDKALPGFSNYYTAVCPNGVQNVKAYTGVTYKNIYRNIDLHYYEKDGQLKYDYLVAAGADFRQIALEIEGAEKISLNAKGELVITTPLGDIIEQAPLVQQKERILPSKWVISRDNGKIIRFEIEDLNPNEAFVIDPVVTREWSSYYGGNNTDEVYSCTTDKKGNVLMAGYSNSTGGIALVGGHQGFLTGSWDGFLAKFDSGGQRLWATYFGGTSYERVNGICTDALESVYITGYTNSNLNGGISTPGSHQPNFGGANEDAFIAKFDKDGARQWSTFYGGHNSDIGTACVVDRFGDLYVTGYTDANNGTSIATGGGYQTTLSGLTDAFLVKFTSAGQRLWGTYYGDAGVQQGFGCATDTLGNIYICGRTGPGATILGSVGSHQTAFGGGTSDCFLAKFNTYGVREWGTLYGGSQAEEAFGCATDIFNNVYMTGYTRSTSAIATPGSHQPSYSAVEDGFLVKFDETGQRLWGTYYGGIYGDRSFACFTDLLGNVYFSGIAVSAGPNVIATTGSQQTAEGGGGYNDAYLVKFNPNGQRQWGTYYGGSNNDVGRSCAGDNFGNLYMAGYTSSPVSPLMVTSGAHQTTFGGNNDGFLAKYVECPPQEPVSSTPAANLNICENETAILTAIGASSIYWYADPTGGAALTIGSTFTTPALNAGAYTYYAEASSSCGPSAVRVAITVNVNVCTSIADLSLNGSQGIAIYPNPVSSEFFVEVATPGSYVLTNVLGQVILEGQLAAGKNPLHLNDQKKGIYLVRVVTGNQTAAYKLLKD